MPERPDDPPPRARVLTDSERAEAARMREIVRKAPPLSAPAPRFPTEPPWTAGLAELAGLWLDVRCACGAHSALPLRFLAALRGWKTTLGEILPRLRCQACGARPASVDLTDDPTLGAAGVPKSGRRNRLHLIGAGQGK